MGGSPRCYITSFVKIGLPVPEKTKPYIGNGGHLGHVTSIMSSDFYFLVPESFHKKIDTDPQSSF